MSGENQFMWCPLSIQDVENQLILKVKLGLLVTTNKTKR